jgi:hypothetical protein
MAKAKKAYQKLTKGCKGLVIEVELGINAYKGTTFSRHFDLNIGINRYDFRI